MMPQCFNLSSYCQCSEILVTGNYNPLLRFTRFHDLLIFGCSGPVARKINIVPFLTELRGQSAACTDVHEKVHVTASTSTGSVRSRPTIRAAYSKHA